MGSVFFFFFYHFFKGENFCDFLFASRTEKRSGLKGNTGENSFLLELNVFVGREAKQF